MSLSSTSSPSPPPHRPKLGPAIGIDLGTTYSCVGVYDTHTQAVTIISDGEGHRTCPSYVAFGDEARTIGHLAKERASLAPANTLFDVKRLIGRKYGDPSVRSDAPLLPFALREAEQGDILIEVTMRGEKRLFSPEEVSSFLLFHLKRVAERHAQQEVRHAVITVPAYFSDAQRQATKDAGTIAGLNVLRIINEPTAAAIAYGLQEGGEKGKSRNILIFDLGGGTFDVSLLSVTDGIFEVKATAGDTHLGGEDFDQKLMDHFLEQIKKERGEAAAREMGEVGLRKLRTAAEQAKCELSSSLSTSIHIPSLLPSYSFSFTLSRSSFESICSSSFQRTLQPVEQVLRDARMDKREVDEIVLVGGSTRIPRVQQLISAFFDGKKLNSSINPDEAVAYGASVLAAMLAGNIPSSNAAADLLLIDVTPLSLGIETSGGMMSKLIQRNTSIPCRARHVYTTTEDQQRSVEIQVFEGERVRTSDNNCLGVFELTDLPPLPAGKLAIEVLFDIDANGILSVSATEKSSGKSNRLAISDNKGRLNGEQIEKMVEEAALFNAADLKANELACARSSLENYAVRLRELVNSSSSGGG